MQQSGSALSFILDLLFPRVCLCCEKWGSYFCPDCQKKAKVLTDTICPFCLKTTREGVRHPKCTGHISGLFSVWEYEDTVQTTIKEVKYRFYSAAVEEVMQAYWYALLRVPHQGFFTFLRERPLIVPVPLHPKKYAQRDFNQASLIAREVAKKFSLPMSEKIIVRSKYTKPQAELEKAERIHNMKHAFAPSSEVVKLGKKPLNQKSVLLVDDVWTTGSTMQAAASVVHSLGAFNIWALTLAR